MDPKEIYEVVAYAISVPMFALSSLVLGLNPVLSALAALFLAIGVFYRSWIVAWLALLAYVAAVALSPPELTIQTALIFCGLNMFPFFICFRSAHAKAGGFAPLEPLGALASLFVLGALLLLDMGVFFASAEALSPGGFVAAAFVSMLLAALALPVLGWAIGRVWHAG